MYYIYILQSLKKPGWLYKGTTSDLIKRVKEHNAGKNFSTAPYTPFRLIYYEAYLLKSDAKAREKYLKTSMGKRVIKKQLANFLKAQKARHTVKTYSVAKIRVQHPKAYAKWTVEDDASLKRQYHIGKTVDELAIIFQRQPNAIRSRLQKLGLMK